MDQGSVKAKVAPVAQRGPTAVMLLSLSVGTLAAHACCTDADVTAD